MLIILSCGRSGRTSGSSVTPANSGSHSRQTAGSVRALNENSRDRLINRRVAIAIQMPNQRANRPTVGIQRGGQRNGNQLMIEINESEESDDSTDGPMNGFPVNVNAMPIDMSDESVFDAENDDEEDEEN